MGAIGFALNGVPIYNPYNGRCCDAGTYELTVWDSFSQMISNQSGGIKVALKTPSLYGKHAECCAKEWQHLSPHADSTV